MKRIIALFAAGFLVLALVGWSAIVEGAIAQEEEDEDAQATEEVVVGGFVVEGPEGRQVFIPEATVERQAAEEYLDEVRPIAEDTAQDISEVITPTAELQDQTLTLSIRVESIEEAQQVAQNGLEELQQVQPPEDLEPVHEQLVDAYEQALPAYENIIEAFQSEDIDTLTSAAQENLPEIEQLVVQSRAILQELERATTQDAPVESGQ